MIVYQNLPPEQRATQGLVDQFDEDERLWERLGPGRRLRRMYRRRLCRKKLHKIDLLEFANARPPQDCVAPEPGT